MVDRDNTSPHEDGIVLTVRYTSVLFWPGQVFLLFCGCAMLACVFPLFWKGAYLKMILVIPGGLFCVYGAISQSLTKRLVFYEDRVVQVWHFLGERTVYYARARFYTSTGYLAWLKKGFCIRDMTEDGLFAQLTGILGISYNPVFAHPDTNKKVDKIMAYLTEDSDNSPRVFKNTELPKEIV